MSRVALKKYARLSVIVVLVGATCLIAPKSASAALCGGRHCYIAQYTYDIANANGDGASAGWQEQNSVLADPTAGFVYQGFWVETKATLGTYVEGGYLHMPSYCGTPSGYCWVTSRHINDQPMGVIVIPNQSASGPLTWHTYQWLYNGFSGLYQFYIDGAQKGASYSQSLSEI